MGEEVSQWKLEGFDWLFYLFIFFGPLQGQNPGLSIGNLES